jgi:hypothetical protein
LKLSYIQLDYDYVGKIACIENRCGIVQLYTACGDEDGVCEVLDTHASIKCTTVWIEKTYSKVSAFNNSAVTSLRWKAKEALALLSTFTAIVNDHFIGEGAFSRSSSNKTSLTHRPNELHRSVTETSTTTLKLSSSNIFLCPVATGRQFILFLNGIGKKMWN